MGGVERLVKMKDEGGITEKEENKERQRRRGDKAQKEERREG